MTNSPTGDRSIYRPRAGTNGARLLANRSDKVCVRWSRHRVANNSLLVALPSSAYRRRGSPRAGPDDDGPEKACLPRLCWSESEGCSCEDWSAFTIIWHWGRDQRPQFPPPDPHPLPSFLFRFRAVRGRKYLVGTERRLEAAPVVTTARASATSHLLHVALPCFDLRPDPADDDGEQFS